MNIEQDRYAQKLLHTCVLGQKLEYCWLLDYYVAIARLLGRLKVKGVKPGDIFGPGPFNPPVSPEAAAPGTIAHCLFDGDPDPIPARIFPTVEHGLEKSRIKESLKLATQMKAVLDAVSKQLTADIAELKKASA